MSKRILNMDHLKILYYSLVHPHLTYGQLIWGNTHKKYLHQLEIAQKKCMRSLTNSKYNAPSAPLFKYTKILQLNELYKLQALMFMYKFVTKQLPVPLLKLFVLRSDTHRHVTRHSTDPEPCDPNSDLLKRSFLYVAPYLWSKIDDPTKSSKSSKNFKHLLTKKYLSEYC